jgi:uncharacterized protein YndB with AHSA1/START domain
MSDDDPSAARVQRVMPARPDYVFDAWVDPEALAEFLGPYPVKVTVLECDANVDGRLELEMSDDDGIVRISGRYLELSRPARIRFTWSSDMGGGFDSVVTVTFQPHGDAETLMTIYHAPLPDALRGDHESGWTLIAWQLAHRLVLGSP